MERDRPHQDFFRDHAKNIIIHGTLLFTISSQHNFPSPASPYACFLASSPRFSLPLLLLLVVPAQLHVSTDLWLWQEPNSNRFKPEWYSFRSSWIQVLYNGIGNSFSPYLDSDFLSWPHLQWVRWPPAAPNLDIPLACYQPGNNGYLMVLWPFQGEVQQPSLDDTSVPEPVTLARIY